MALTRNSRAVAAREKALRLARAAQEREAVLLSLAEEYFVLTDEADAVREAARAKGESLVEAAKAKAAQLLADAEVDATARLEKAPDVVSRMLATGASRADVASRLDVSVSTVRKMGVGSVRPVGVPEQGVPATAPVQEPEGVPPHGNGGDRGEPWQEQPAHHEYVSGPVPVG